MAASAAEKQLECGDAAMDWAAIENEHAYTPAQKQAFQEQYAKTLSSIGDNEVVEGTVVSITGGCAEHQRVPLQPLLAGGR